jgi:hypothetical protein
LEAINNRNAWTAAKNQKPPKTSKHDYANTAFPRNTSTRLKFEC